MGQAHAELPWASRVTASPRAQRELQLLGGPQLSDLAGRMGTTHFNK